MINPKDTGGNVEVWLLAVEKTMRKVGAVYVRLAYCKGAGVANRRNKSEGSCAMGVGLRTSLAS